MAKQTAVRAESRAAIPPSVVPFTLPENQIEALELSRACIADAGDALSGMLDLVRAARPGEHIACERIAALLQSPVGDIEQARDALELVEGGDHAQTH